MWRQELVRLVERTMAGEGTEAEHDALLLQLQDNVPHPQVLGLVYHSAPPLTAEQVVDEVLAYLPIEL